MLRDESLFVVEWVNYNLWIGFDHIVILNNDDDPTPLNELLARYVKKGYVTLVNWKYWVISITLTEMVFVVLENLPQV